MFDIGFAELLLIAVIAVVVIGPQRLPETIRFIGLWLGRLKRALTRLAKDMEREVGMDDIRRQLHNEEILSSLKELENTVKPDPIPNASSDAEKPAAEDKT